MRPDERKWMNKLFINMAGVGMALSGLATIMTMTIQDYSASIYNLFLLFLNSIVFVVWKIREVKDE